MADKLTLNNKTSKPFLDEYGKTNVGRKIKIHARLFDMPIIFQFTFQVVNSLTGSDLRYELKGSPIMAGFCSLASVKKKKIKKKAEFVYFIEKKCISSLFSQNFNIFDKS